MSEQNKKITVIGLGGVGGYIGAMLADVNDQVTFVVRGERKLSLEKNGLRLHSDFSGDKTVYAGRLVESCREVTDIQDIVFLCVKAYSLESVCKEMLHCIDEHTVVVPVMNGADTADRVRKYLSQGIVIDSVIYITSFYEKDYSIRQLGNYAKILIGAGEDQKEALQSVYMCMKHAGMDCRIPEDIRAAVWEKYIFNCGYNVLTSYYMEMVETLQKSQVKSGEFRILMEEALSVAEKKGIRIRENYIEEEYQRFMNLDAGSTSSMKRDLESGRPSELETFSGYLTREAERLQIPVPVSDRMYREIRNRIGR